MRRNGPILSGLAILSVIFNHANWHVLESFQSGQLGGIPFIIFDQLGKFAIAAFIFIAGSFCAYAFSGNPSLRWRATRRRVLMLLPPWIIWTVVMLFGLTLRDQPASWDSFLRIMFAQYYFVPLLIFYYLLAPFFAPLVQRNPVKVLIAAAVIQLLGMGLFYARVYLPGFPGGLATWVDLGPLEYLRFIFLFTFGLVSGLHPSLIKKPLLKIKPALPWMVLLFLALSCVEGLITYYRGYPAWTIGDDQTKLTSVLLSLALISCFIAYDRINIPLRAGLIEIGAHSYGIYLTHYAILGMIAGLVESMLPSLAAIGWLLLPLLFITTTAASLGMIIVISKLPTRFIYRYLFG